MPPTACTETAPPGSSTSRRSSNHSTEKVTTAPAIEPITTASAGTTKAHEALLATSPPTQPLALSEASGLPKRILGDDGCRERRGSRSQHGIDGNQHGHLTVRRR